MLKELQVSRSKMNFQQDIDQDIKTAPYRFKKIVILYDTDRQLGNQTNLVKLSSRHN